MFLAYNIKDFLSGAKLNANPARIGFDLALGKILATIGLSWVLVNVFAFNSIWIRALGVPPAVVGAVLWYLASKGLCLVLYVTSSSQVKPWDVDHGSDWKASYKKRLLIRKIFDRTMSATDKDVKKLQLILFLQGVLLGFGVLALLLSIILPIPATREFF